MAGCLCWPTEWAGTSCGEVASRTAVESVLAGFRERAAGEAARRALLQRLVQKRQRACH